MSKHASSGDQAAGEDKNGQPRQVAAAEAAFAAARRGGAIAPGETTTQALPANAAAAAETISADGKLKAARDSAGTGSGPAAVEDTAGVGSGPAAVEDTVGAGSAPEAAKDAAGTRGALGAIEIMAGAVRAPEAVEDAAEESRAPEAAEGVADTGIEPGTVQRIADSGSALGTTQGAADPGTQSEAAEGEADVDSRRAAAEEMAGARSKPGLAKSHQQSRQGAALLSERHGRVLQLLISNPTARNALSPDMYATARQALREASEDADIGAVVIAGDGPTFCAGGNLHRLLANRSQPLSVQRDSIEALHGWVRALQACDKPVIAAVEGAAAGAGCSIALACDLIVAASDARFVLSYVKVGLSPDGGATWAAMRLLPTQTAMQLLVEGDALPAARLHALGVVNALVDPGRALQEAMQRAARLAEGPSRTIARIKRLARAARFNELAQQLDLERDGFVDALHAAEAAEGIAAFLEKRAPRWH